MIGFPNNTQQKRGSMGAALIFMLIAVMGVLLIYLSPTSKLSNSQSQYGYADSTSTEITNATLEKAAPSGIGYVFRSLLIMGSILIFFYVGMRIYRRKKTGNMPGYYQVRVLGRQYLGPKQYLALVEWNDQRLLLGVTDNQITKLSVQDINDKDFQEQLGLVQKD